MWPMMFFRFGLPSRLSKAIHCQRVPDVMCNHKQTLGPGSQGVHSHYGQVLGKIRLCKIIRVGTDCSGLDAPMLALRRCSVLYGAGLTRLFSVPGELDGGGFQQRRLPIAGSLREVSCRTHRDGSKLNPGPRSRLGLNGVRHVFASEINKHARQALEANFRPETLYHDLRMRRCSTMSRVELYVAGFPCQPFSSSGLREGTEDKLGRGSIFKYIFRYISKRRPRVYVLENVRGLSTHSCYGEMLTALRSLSLYNVYTRILNPEVRRGNVSYVGYRSFCWVNQTSLSKSVYILLVPCPVAVGIPISMVRCQP